MIKPNQYARRVCVKRTCGNKSYCRSLCKRHYEHQKWYGRPLNIQEQRILGRSVNNIRVIDGVGNILTTKGIIFIDGDVQTTRLVLRKRWYISKGGYAVSGGVYLHQYLLGNRDGRVIDHKNRNRLDNRRANLRFVTSSENSANYTPHGLSGVRGVYWDIQTEKWRVQVNRRSYGRFESLSEAAEVAYRARLDLYGADFA